MPNWCYTHCDVKFNKEDLTKVQKLFSDINEWTSKDYVSNGFGHQWPGNIVGFSGLDLCTEDSNFEIRCRGSLTMMELSDNVLSFDTETAWAPMFEMWVKLFEKYEIDYTHFLFDSTDEFSNFFISNRPEYKGKYVIDIWDDEIHEKLNIWEHIDEATEEEAIKALQTVLNTDCSDFEKLQDMLQHSDVDGIWVGEWDEEQIEDYCYR